MMLLLGNVILLAVVLYFIATIIDRYNQIIFDKYRFKYFVIRDRLAMLVVEGKLKEDSWEYKQIIDTINFHIKTIESVSINKIISMLINHLTSNAEERKVKIITKNIEHPEVIAVMADFMDVTVSLLERSSKMQIKLLKICSKASQRSHRRDMSSIVDHKKGLDKAITYRDNLRDSLTDLEMAA